MKYCLMKNWIILCGFVCLYETKIIISIKIYDYQNSDNLLHNGNKCENFHWAGDHCDPMFKICVSGKYNCDLYYESTRFWANNKYVSNILSKEVESYNFQNVIKIKVDVDDHDRFDEHDHIGVFRATFNIGYANYDRTLYMDYGPRSLDIRLKARIKVSCANHFYGPTCSAYCFPGDNYECSPQNGEKICSKYFYGQNCNKKCVPNSYFSCSPKSGERICKPMCVSKEACIYSTDKQAFLCYCYGNWNRFTCQIDKLPYFSTISTKSITSVKSKITFSPTTSPKLFYYTSSPRKLNYFSKSFYMRKISGLSSIIYNKPSVFQNIVTEDKNVFSKLPNTLNSYTNKSVTINPNEMKNKTLNIPIKNPQSEAESSNLKSLKITDKEKSSNQGNNGIMQVFYVISIGLLAIFFMFFLLRYWKLKYKLKVLEVSHAEEIVPQVIYRPNLQIRNTSKFQSDEMSNHYAAIDSVYDSCTVSTNLNDEMFYEEPIIKINTNLKWENHF